MRPPSGPAGGGGYGANADSPAPCTWSKASGAPPAIPAPALNYNAPLISPQAYGQQGWGTPGYGQQQQAATDSWGAAAPTSQGWGFQQQHRPVGSATMTPPPAPKKATAAFAILPTSSGPVLAPPGSVDNMLRADWGLFLELAAYTLHGHMEDRIAFGIEEVAEAIKQAAVAVLFIPVSCGHGGETAVRGVAICGGRGYIVGSTHELYEDVDDWGAAAILHQPLARIRPKRGGAAEENADEPADKKVKLDKEQNAPVVGGVSKAASWAVPSNVAKATLVKTPPGLDVKMQLHDFAQQEEVPAGPPPEPLPEPTDKELRRQLKHLGKAENLEDKHSIPRCTEAVRERFLPALGPSVVYTAFADLFIKAKGVAHRKAMAYVVHELFMGKRGAAMKPEERRVVCVDKFLVRIGKMIRGFGSEERQAYVKLLTTLTKARIMFPDEVSKVKDAWDMD